MRGDLLRTVDLDTRADWYRTSKRLYTDIHSDLCLLGKVRIGPYHEGLCDEFAVETPESRL